MDLVNRVLLAFQRDGAGEFFDENPSLQYVADAFSSGLFQGIEDLADFVHQNGGNSTREHLAAAPILFYLKETILAGYVLGACGAYDVAGESREMLNSLGAELDVGFRPLQSGGTTYIHVHYRPIIKGYTALSTALSAYMDSVFRGVYELSLREIAARLGKSAEKKGLDAVRDQIELFGSALLRTAYQTGLEDFAKQ